MPLGLKYRTVRLVDHDPRWSRAFEDERLPIADSLADLGCGIEHVGSTSVPGLRAKPIIDIAVGVPDLAEVAECIARLEALGYIYRGDAGKDGGHVLVRAIGDVRTHHVHIVPLDGPQWRAYLALRAILRRHAWARDEYATVKAELAKRFPNDHMAYQHGKTAVVEQLLAKAG